MTYVAYRFARGVCWWYVYLALNEDQVQEDKKGRRIRDDPCMDCIIAVIDYGVGVAVLVGVRETSMPSVCEPSTTIRPLRKPRMVLAYPAKAL